MYIHVLWYYIVCYYMYVYVIAEFMYMYMYMYMYIGCCAYTFSFMTVEPVPTFMKTSSIVVRDTPKLVNPNLSLCSVCVSVQKYGIKRCGREGEERREGGTSWSSCEVVQCGVVILLFSRSSVSRRVGKCWLEVKGRRKVSSALMSEAS